MKKLFLMERVFSFSIEKDGKKWYDILLYCKKG